MIATAKIETGTIISEYGGEVMNSKEVVKEQNRNDSVFRLVVGNESKSSLDVCPINYSNISRFISGINNSLKYHRSLENVRSVRFAYKGRIRIVIIAKREIAAGEILYLDYNGGLEYEYPTHHFTD